MAKTWRFVFLWLTVVLIMSVAGTACSSTSSSSVAPTATAAKSTPSTPASGGQTTPAAASTAPAKTGTTQFAGTVNLATIGPLTGAIAASGIDLTQGAELAVDHINAAGGVKIGDKAYKLNVIRYDDQYKPEVAVNLARRIRSMDNASFIVGMGMSSSILATMEINEKEEILMIVQGTTPAITEKGNKLIVRTNNPTSYDAPRIAEVAMKDGLKNWGILADSQDWGKTMVDFWTTTVNKNGGKVLGTEMVDEGKQTDFYPQITKVIAQKPDVLGLAVRDQAGSLIIKQARELGYTGPVVMNTGFGSDGIRLAGWDKLGVGSYIFVNPADMGVQPAIKYIEDYKVKFGVEGQKNQSGMLSYSHTKLLAAAMEKAGTVTDVAKIRAAIPEAYQAVGKQTPFEFMKYDESGQINISSPIAKHVGGGKLDLVAK